LIKLFDKTTEFIHGSSKNNENSYNYYQKSSREDIGIIRNVLETWFSKFPEDEKKELKNRFKKDLDSAFFELFLFTLLSKLGFKIEIHPELKTSKKRPDFLITKNGLSAYVEAKICYDKIDEEMAFERMQNQFYDDINKVRIEGFLLAIDELEFKTKKQPSVKALNAKIVKEIELLDPKNVSAQLKKYGFEYIPKIEFENTDVKIVLKAMPLPESEQERISESPIGIFPIETFWGGGEESLKTSIIKKAKRYGKFEIPYLICVNSLGKKTSGKIDIENVIWGSLQYSYSTDPKNRNGKTTRAQNGVFYNSKKAKLTNVSGILVTKIFPSNIPNGKYWVYKNPFATNEFEFENLGLVYSYVEENKIISNEGNDFDVIFGIPKDWLHE